MIPLDGGAGHNDLDPQTLLTPLDSGFYRHHRVRVAMLRLDRVHSQISGNKWFKLLCLSARLSAGERLSVLSFGGVWSNHLHALAYLGQQYGIRTLGLVRGDARQAETAMMSDARRWGMEFVYLTREQYRRRNESDFLSQLKAQYPGWEIVPEGGSNRYAVHGCSRIWQLLQGSGWETPDYVACAVGTGGTFAGLVAGKPQATHLIGVPVLRLGDAGVEQVRTLLDAAGYEDPGGWSLASGGDFGGYARVPSSLAAFLVRAERYGVPLEPVYTAKLMAAVHRAIQLGVILPGSRLLLVHTGGLQGRRGMEAQIVDRAAAFHGPLFV